MTNGLKHSTILSIVKQLDINSFDDIVLNAPRDAWFIAYLFHRVVIGRFTKGKFDYYEEEKSDLILENLIKLRVFDNSHELYVWRTNSGRFKGRLRSDGVGAETDVVDANQIIAGTKAGIKDDRYHLLTEERGTEVIISMHDLGISAAEINDKEGRLCIHTRNYIGEIEETGQATYEDVRFVEFVKYQEDI